ncbi:unnamed protein product [Symbiodinium sp. CCMP2456]|nr:unnamed protein product [Symbiodinium sp. CCMP2456]
MLPYLPNVADWVFFVLQVLWKTVRFSDESLQWPGWWAEPPPRLLPPMTEVGIQEMHVRQVYWVSALMLGPPLLCTICLLVRLVALSWPGHHGHQLEGRIALSVDASDDSDDSSASPCGQLPQMRSFTGLRMVVAAYHIVCIVLVLLAFVRGWLSLRSGLAWEIWFLWQQMCLWTLFCQNFLRCCSPVGPASWMATAKTILMFTLPFFSEIFDTMKDWIVAGQCLMAPHTIPGFLFGAAVVAIDLLASLYLGVPQCLPAWPSLLLVQGFCLLPVLLPLFIFAIGSILPFDDAGPFLSVALALLVIVVIVLCETFPACPMLARIVIYLIAVYLAYLAWPYTVDNPHPLGSLSFVITHIFGFMKDMWMDGSCLCVASAYVILHAYVLALQSTAAADDLRKTYYGIIALPFPTASVDARCAVKLTLWLEDFAVDFLSYARLLIAWVEDWPQGFIGIFVGLITGSRFAWLSALVSIGKGVLIPAGQEAVLQCKRRQLRDRLTDLIWPKPECYEGFKKCAARLAEHGQDLKLNAISGLVKDWLLAETSEILVQLNILPGKHLYSGMYEDRGRWVEKTIAGRIEAALTAGTSLDALPRVSEEFIRGRTHTRLSLTDKFVEVVYGFYLESHMSRVTDRSANLRYLLGQGHPSRICRLTGFSLDEFLDAGFSPHICKEAGFSIEDRVSAGVRRGFSATDCRAAWPDVDAQTLRRVGFDAHACKAAGFGLEDCKTAGFEKQECMDCWPSKEVEEAFRPRSPRGHFPAASRI